MELGTQPPWKANGYWIHNWLSKSQPKLFVDWTVQWVLITVWPLHHMGMISTLVEQRFSKGKGVLVPCWCLDIQIIQWLDLYYGYSLWVKFKSKFLLCASKFHWSKWMSTSIVTNCRWNSALWQGPAQSICTTKVTHPQKIIVLQ